MLGDIIPALAGQYRLYLPERQARDGPPTGTGR
jgi:hypothetical protein